MTVERVIEVVDEVNNFIDDLSQLGGKTFTEGDALKLSDILIDYRDMLLAMKVKTN